VRIRCAVLLAWLGATLVCLVLAPSATAAGLSPAAGSAYPWVQPWSIHGAAASTVGHWTQPPASVQLTAPAGQTVVMPRPGGSYPWVQPWSLRSGAAPDVGRWTQPPASIPAG